MGDIVQAGPNTAAYPMVPGDVDQIKAWMRGAAAVAALNATKNALANYTSGPFASWLANYNAGRAEEPPPGIPQGFSAQMSDDGLDYTLIPSGAPCGTTPTYTKRVVTPSTLTGLINPNVTPQAPALLIGPIGGQVTQRDGTIWVRIS